MSESRHNGHHHHTHHFPDGFLWGTATSAHQVEGNNYNNDWWQAEQVGTIKHKSGKSSDHYHKYEQDFDLAKRMHNNSHRLSVEWSRVQPKEDVWNQHEIEHYRKVLRALQDRGMKTMVTLHHFTVPTWFSDKGGFEKRRNVKHFVEFARYMADQLDGLVDMWITINEPGVYMYMGYKTGEWVPNKKSTLLGYRVYLNLALAHKRAYRAIHAVAKKRGFTAQVGIAQNMLSFATYRKHALIDTLAVWLSVKFTNHGFYYLTSRKTHDFYGINFYFRVRLRRKKGTLKIIQDDVSAQERETSDMGWEIYPHGLFDVMMDMRDYGKPIYITENGIASTNDDKRQRFLVAHVSEIYHAIKAGVDVRGYYHWSLLDNFEWHQGYGPRFGLIEVNFKTLQREMRPSARLYGQIAANNGLTHHMYRLLGHEAKL